MMDLVNRKKTGIRSCDRSVFLYKQSRSIEEKNGFYGSVQRKIIEETKNKERDQYSKINVPAK